MERSTVKDLRDRIQKALDDAGIEGFVLKVGNASYGETSAMSTRGLVAQSFRKSL